MNKIFLFCILLLIGLNNCIANESKQKKYKLATTILFTNGLELITTVDAIYPTFEEVHCTDKTIVVSIIIDAQGNITKPENLISGTDYFIEEIQDAIENFTTPKLYYGLEGVMSIRFSLLKEPISKTIYASAVEMFKSGQFNESFSRLSEIKGNDSNNICVLMSMGDALTKQGKYSQAIPYYDQALEISPLNDRIYYSRAYRRYKSGLLDKAIEDIQNSIKLRDVWENYYLLNEIYNQKEDYLKAIKYATLGFKYKAGSYFHNRRGWSYLANGNYQLAIMDFDKIIELEPNNQLGYTGKSRALYLQEKYQEAIKYINISIKLDSNDHELSFDKARILDDQFKLDEAIDIYKYLIKNSFSEGKVFNNLGWALIRQNKLDDAIDILSYAIQNNLNSDLLRNNLATAYYLNKQYELALKTYQAEIKDNELDRNVFATAGMARCYIKLNQLDKSLIALKYVINTDANFGDAYYRHKYGKGNYIPMTLQEFKEQAKENNSTEMLTEIDKLINKVDNNE
jgi:tetratricopeptide (TPR) repeat protein